jgi:hypothetical protein
MHSALMRAETESSRARVRLDCRCNLRAGEIKPDTTQAFTLTSSYPCTRAQLATQGYGVGFRVEKQEGCSGYSTAATTSAEVA